MSSAFLMKASDLRQARRLAGILVDGLRYRAAPAAKKKRAVRR
jgi:hypothetical protein